MIKLKIGDNYLITDNKDVKKRDFIIYTMTCFNKQNQVLLGLDLEYHNLKPKMRRDYQHYDYIQFLKAERIKDIWILTALPSREPTDVAMYKMSLNAFLERLKIEIPDIQYKVIKFNDKNLTKEFNLGGKVYDALEQDDKNILHYIDKLDEYKQFANRYKAIPAELKVVNESIKQLSKEKKITDRKTTLQDLEYLHLIDDASLEGDSLILTIKPLPIYTSEPMGKFIPAEDFRKNKYLYEAAKHIYMGGHFGMVGTKIRVNSQFKPEFIETLDHSYDDMFEVNNWSNIGYLHFGRGHLCGGEFNDVIAHTAEHGLEYYFMCLKQYITTANIRDYAGRKVWWYPIYNDKNELVYCAGLDILRDWCIGEGIGNAEQLLNMSIPEFLEWKRQHNDLRLFARLSTRYTSSSIGNYSGKEDTFLQVCQEKDPEIYDMIMKGANNNG